MTLGIAGAGGHGQVVADAFIRALREEKLPLRAVFFDDCPALLGSAPLDIPVVGQLSAMTLEHCGMFVAAIGDNRRRREVFQAGISNGVQPHSVRHPGTTLADSVQLGPGCMILAGVVVNTGSSIGRNVILNTGCSLDHHAKVADHVHVAPGVRIGGNVTLGEGVLVGIGAVLLPGVSIGPWATVGAGAVVLRDVPPGVTVVGNPAHEVTS